MGGWRNKGKEGDKEKERGAREDSCTNISYPPRQIDRQIEERKRYEERKKKFFEKFESLHTFDPSCLQLFWILEWSSSYDTFVSFFMGSYFVQG